MAQAYSEAQWAKPSTKLHWYNSYLISLYEKNIGWAGIGRIEEVIGYPGDEEAAKQLEQGWLTPLPGADGQDYPSMPAGKQPAPPTGPPRDFRGEVIDLTPKKKRTIRQWIRYWTSKDEAQRFLFHL